MSRIDLAALAAACYTLSASDEVWFAGLVPVLAPLLDTGHGIAAWSYQTGDYGPSAQLPVGVAPEIGRAMHAAAALVPEELATRFFLGPRTQSATERIGRASGLQDEPWFASLRALGIRDFGALTLLDPSGAGLAFAAPAAQLVRTSRTFRYRLERVGAHILAGFRLRRVLGEVDAVLGTDGKLLDAREEARAPEQREALRAAVKAFDRAGSRRSHADPDGALDAWQALVSGRWSLVQSFESDGRRYLVARRNPPGDAPYPGLTALEAQALLLRAQGASYKLIAYELGLSAAAAHSLVQRGSARLGIRSESELPAFASHVLRTAPALVDLATPRTSSSG